MGRRSNRRNHGLKIAALLLIGAIGIGGALVAYNFDWLKAQYLRYITLDFEGPGVGEVIIRVEKGDDGLSIANKLFEAGVIADVDSFYRLLIAENPTFYPGSFRLKLEMSNESALRVIADANNAMTYKITIPEGYRAFQIFEEISKVSGIDPKKILAAASNLEGLGIPAEAPTIEGYLFPATYSFDPSATETDILKTMVDRMKAELSAFGVLGEDVHRVLTLASIIQREGKHPEDFYKISRVFHNRLKLDMLLQTDPTISYSFDGEDRSGDSKAEAIDYGYNTYLVKGLPPGPISSPGSLAIDAALNPAKGKWLYFVTINLESGETKFSQTFAEHERYVKLLRQWEAENPGWYDN
ncbi:MAG: endolytic transglycosylase MltG [Actinomycetota bacterium]